MAAHDHSTDGFGIGAGLRRKETERFIQGAGTYADDVQLPQQAYAAFVRSYAAHATIDGIDTIVGTWMSNFCESMKAYA